MNKRIAELYPQADFTVLPGFRAPAYASVGRKLAIVGNGFLEVRLELDREHRDHIVVLNKLTGEPIHLEFTPIDIWLGADAPGKVSRNLNSPLRLEAHSTGGTATLTAQLQFGLFEVELTYLIQRGQHFVQKNMTVHSIQRPVYLQRVSLFRQTVVPALSVVPHDGGQYCPLVFVRSEKGSLFFAVDYPGYFVHVDGRSFHFDYYPGVRLEPGRSFRLLSSLVGICERTGRTRLNPYHETAAELDIAEQQAFRECLLFGQYNRERPRVEVKGPEPGILGPSDLELLDQCTWFGARDVLLPRIIAALDAHPMAETVADRIRSEGISAGLVIARDSGQGTLRSGERRTRAGLSQSVDTCVAMEELDQRLVERYVALMESHGLRRAELTGPPVAMRSSPDDDEADRMASLQQAIQGVVEAVATLREYSGHVGCFGPYAFFGSGMARLCDSISLTATDHPLALPDLHIGRLFADMQRLYFRRSFSYLLPRTSITLAVGPDPSACPDAPYPGTAHYPWYVYFDREGWRYSLISALATGLQYRFNAVPQDISPEDRAFANKWLIWARERLADLKHVQEIFSEPGLRQVDGYSYTTGRASIVFLFNTGYAPADVTLNLRLQHDSDYVVRELYPREMNYLGPNQGLFRRDSALTLTLQPKEARIVEAVRRSPASARRRRPEIFGAPAAETRESVSAVGRPGESVRIGIRVGSRFSEREVKFPGKTVEPFVQDWRGLECLYESGVRTLPKGFIEGERVTPSAALSRNVWLCGHLSVPAELKAHIDATPFVLQRPCWTYARRLFCVIRYEPESAFDPIRTPRNDACAQNSYTGPSTIRCGFDLGPLNLGFHAWINGEECTVYPALAAWDGYWPNPHPVVAYFFEAGSRLHAGSKNTVVLYSAHFHPAAFQGIFIEHMPDMLVESPLENT